MNTRPPVVLRNIPYYGIQGKVVDIPSIFQQYQFTINGVCTQCKRPDSHSVVRVKFNNAPPCIVVAIVGVDDQMSKFQETIVLLENNNRNFYQATHGMLYKSDFLLLISFRFE